MWMQRNAITIAEDNAGKENFANLNMKNKEVFEEHQNVLMEVDAGILLVESVGSSIQE